jgi:hypothetical protein
METEIKWADGQAITAESEIRWADGGIFVYYYEAEEEPPATDYRMIFHNHYQQMKVT